MRMGHSIFFHILLYTPPQGTGRPGDENLDSTNLKDPRALNLESLKVSSLCYS